MGARRACGRTKAADSDADDARDGEPVLKLQKTRHRFGPGPTVPSTGISSSYLGPLDLEARFGIAHTTIQTERGVETACQLSNPARR